MCADRSDFLPKNLLHRFPFVGSSISYVYIAHVSHERIFDFIHVHPPHDTFNERTIWMNGWGLSKNSFKVVFLFYLLAQSYLGTRG